MTLETKAHIDTDLKSAMGDLLYTFEQFKSENDARLASLEEKGSDDPLTSEKLSRIDAALSRQQEAINALSTQQARPPLGGESHLPISEAKAAFDSYVRFGTPVAPEVKAIAASDSDGGVIAPVETATTINSALKSISPIRQIATVREISGQIYRKPLMTSDFGVGWVGEASSRPQTGTPSIAALDFPAMELYAMPATTQALLDDSVVDVGQWIADEVQAEFASQESAAFVAGDGVNKPRGFLDYNTAADDSRTASELGTISSAGAAITGDDLIDLVYTLGQTYRGNGRFIMNRQTAATVRKLKDSDGNYLWAPGLAAGQPSTLMGFGVIESEDMPDAASGATPIAFGDFARGYLIVDRAGINILRDPFSAKPYVLFYTTKRVGGGVQDFAAIKFLEMSA